MSVNPASIFADRPVKSDRSIERNAMWSEDLIKPASTLIPVPRLAGDGMLFEIDAIAAISNS